MKKYLIILMFMCACSHVEKMPEGSYAYDKQFLQDNGIEFVELCSDDGNARVLAVPAWQGRVMTSCASGPGGRSFGWINHEFITKGETSPQFNNYGGEERFWLGPEGGDNSWYFAPGAEQVFRNWKVPAPFDTDVFEVSAHSGKSVVFSKEVLLRNAKGIEFRMEMRRRITLLDKDEILAVYGPVPEDAQVVAYRSENTITNRGSSPWTEDSGMPSVWMLGMFNPSMTTTVYIPYNENGSGKVVKDDYFGPMPQGRLKAEKGVIEFKIDGEFRSKIGVGPDRSLGKVIAIDKEQGTLTALITDIPAPGARFVNSQWGKQDNPFDGDALNSYNDGPTEDGTIMGPFFEIESSSPAAALSPGESLTHIQTTIHIQNG